MNERAPVNRNREGGVWPAWLEPLRPDEMSGRRMRNRILAAAGPLLRARARHASLDVAARWSSVLAPVAAAIALVFGALAHRVGRDVPSPSVETITRPEAAVWEPLLGTAADAPPAILTQASEPSRETVFTAAIAYE
ncbi:MAG: hypothetical protein ACRELC_14240 [Gemmatimonadota bacterium]